MIPPPRRIFAEPPDYEDPADSNADNVYELTLVAKFDDQESNPLGLTVSVTDADEAGSITLSTTHPRNGTAVTATLSDPDDVVSDSATWTWERLAARNSWSAISGANASSYTPAAADTGKFLRVTAAYTDGHGAGKTAVKVPPNVVTGPLLTSLVATTSDSSASTSRELFPAFDPEILNYGIGCGAEDSMALSLAAPSDARLSVNGVQTATGAASAIVPVNTESDVVIRVSESSGDHTTYTVRCLANDLFGYETVKKQDATGVIDDLILFGHPNYLLAMDNDGVPRFRRKIGDHDASARSPIFKAFKVGDDGSYRYAYPQRSEDNQYEYVILDQHLTVIADSITTAAPLAATNSHAFEILKNGNYMLMSYEPAVRDLSHLSFLDPNGSTSVDVRDSAIQIVTPLREAVFSWNSWDHMALEDCAQHYFPILGPGSSPKNRERPDYAHLNSMQMAGEQIVGSFRGCSKVLAIDANTGEVVWRLGHSNLSAEEWAARDIGPRPLEIVNDPKGQFCGQHSARLLPNGNLMLYDNGVVCVSDPWTNLLLVPDRKEYSRAVEYSLDFDNHEAVFVQEHSLRGEQSHIAWSSGMVKSLDNGDWLISWGRAPPRVVLPDNETVTQVDPSTGEEKFAIRFTYSDPVNRPRIIANTLPPEALADDPEPLSAALPTTTTSAFYMGATDSPQVLVAFSHPIVDFDHTSPSLSVREATVTSVSPHLEAGSPANSYLVTLSPTRNEPITFQMVAGESCDSGGVCTADGATLSSVPGHLIIPSSIENTPATGTPTISGTPKVGETLTADTFGIADEDGLDDASFTYQWVRRGGTTDTDIIGATSSTYTLVSADECTTIKVRVSYTDDVGNAETLSSATTGSVEVARGDSPTWKATMTAAPLYVDHGYSNFSGFRNGSLTTTSFDIDDVTYTVKVIEAYGWFYIGFDRKMPTDFTLRVGCTRLDSTDASLTSYSYGNIYRWEDAQISWSEGDTVELRLYIPSVDSD